MRVNTLAVAFALLALLGAGCWWILNRPEIDTTRKREVAIPGSRRYPAAPVPESETGAGTRGDGGATKGSETVPAPILIPDRETPPPSPVDAAGRTWEEAIGRKTPAPDSGRGSLAAADIEIASVLAEDAVNKSVAPMSAGQRRDLEVLLEWYRSHRGTAGDDAEKLRQKLMAAKTDAGLVTILPAIDGPNAPKPPVPPSGIRHAGWPHTVGDVSYWVTITEEDSREYFDLVDLARDPATFLRHRIFTLTSSGQPKD